MSASAFVIEPPAQAAAKVIGGGLFPVRRIFCIGKNYADHVKEMGGDPKKDKPVFFTKPADAVVESGQSFPYAQGTENLHYEGELVVALKGGGKNIATPEAAAALIFGYAAGCDMTRRDLQAAAKSAGGPWDTAKAFDNSAPLGLIVPAKDFPDSKIASSRLKLSVNDEVRQDAALSSMIWSIPEIIVTLSKLFELKAGDLIFTGTPEGVGALVPGDRVEVSIGSLPALEFSIEPKR